MSRTSRRSACSAARSATRSLPIFATGPADAASIGAFLDPQPDHQHHDNHDAHDARHDVEKRIGVDGFGFRLRGPWHGYGFLSMLNPLPSSRIFKSSKRCWAPGAT